MLKYFISICFVLVCFVGISQNKQANTTTKNSAAYKETYGLRIGADLSKLLLTFLNKDYTAIEFVGDYRLAQKLYLAVELGDEKKTNQEDLYNFTTSGRYLKLGVDYNTYKNWYGMNNSIFIGGRYAVSNFSQTLNNYKLFNSNRYWNPEDFAVGSTTPKEFKGLSASWIEFVLGIKTELFTNIFLGSSVRLGFLIKSLNKQPENNSFRNLFIPSFNKVTDGSNFGAGYNFSLSYLIPLYKKAKSK